MTKFRVVAYINTRESDVEIRRMLFLGALYPIQRSRATLRHAQGRLCSAPFPLTGFQDRTLFEGHGQAS